MVLSISFFDLITVIIGISTNDGVPHYVISPSSCYFLALGPDILLSTLISRGVNLCSSLIVRDVVSYSY
jgi:hypothetical protein